MLPKWVDGRTYKGGTCENWEVLGSADNDFESADEDIRDGKTAGHGQESSIGEGICVAGVSNSMVLDG